MKNLETITRQHSQSSNMKSVISNRKKTDNYGSALINRVNVILEIIIRNTLKYNKLTSPEDILETVKMVKSEGDVVQNSYTGSEMDISTIKDICDALCENNGVLIKLKKNDENLYRLNHHDIE